MTHPHIHEQHWAQRLSALPKVPDHPLGHRQDKPQPYGQSPEEHRQVVTGVRGSRTPVPTHPTAMETPSSGWPSWAHRS